jgi:hypothetical protein
MPINRKEVSRTIVIKRPKDLSEEEYDILKDEIGDYVVAAILDKLGDGESPVEGEEFKDLTEKYAKREKKGKTKPNLELTGDMLRSLEYVPTDRGIKVGIFDSSQVDKAYGHNTGFKGHPNEDKLKKYKRQFIPETKQDFDGDIERGIDAIIEDFIDAYQD